MGDVSMEAWTRFRRRWDRRFGQDDGVLGAELRGEGTGKPAAFSRGSGSGRYFSEYAGGEVW